MLVFNLLSCFFVCKTKKVGRGRETKAHIRWLISDRVFGDVQDVLTCFVPLFKIVLSLLTRHFVKRFFSHDSPNNAISSTKKNPVKIKI